MKTKTRIKNITIILEEKKILQVFKQGDGVSQFTEEQLKCKGEGSFKFKHAVDVQPCRGD